MDVPGDIAKIPVPDQVIPASQLTASCTWPATRDRKSWPQQDSDQSSDPQKHHLSLRSRGRGPGPGGGRLHLAGPRLCLDSI